MKWLFAPPAEPRSVSSIILWWELRRLPYNVIVGAVGILSLAAFLALVGHGGDLRPDEDAFEPILLFVVAFAANVCYTAGWVTEIYLLKRHPLESTVAPDLLRWGLIFSLIVVVLPALLSIP